MLLLVLVVGGGVVQEQVQVQVQGGRGRRFGFGKVCCGTVAGVHMPCLVAPACWWRRCGSTGAGVRSSSNLAVEQEREARRNSRMRRRSCCWCCLWKGGWYRSRFRFGRGGWFRSFGKVCFCLLRHSGAYMLLTGVDTPCLACLCFLVAGVW